jgi:hypothetical protein
MSIDKHSVTWFLVKLSSWFEEKKKAVSERRVDDTRDNAPVTC